MSDVFDVLVIGGGPAGYSAALHASRSDYRIALVEERELGGTCLNRGCIPTKAYLDTAGILRSLGDAEKRGIDFAGADPGNFGVSMKRILAFKQRIVKKMSAGVAVLLRESGVRLLRGKASLSIGHDDLFHIPVEGSDAGEWTAKKVVLATGSLPAVPQIGGTDAPETASRILTSDSILEIDFIPKKLAIIGGGVIGIEMGRIFHAFGSEVHIIEAMPAIAPFLDDEIGKTLAETLRGDGIRITTNAGVAHISFDSSRENAENSKNSGNSLPLELALTDGTTIDASHVLVAAGRVPDRRITAHLGLDEYGSAGFVQTDWEMKTSKRGLFAAGDLNGKCMLAHAAIKMGRLAAQAAMQELAGADPIDFRHFVGCRECFPNQVEHFFTCYTPVCIYGEPEIGYIGLTEAVAREYFGDRVTVGRFPFAANGRAVAGGHRTGFAKVVRDSGNDRILGVHIIGPGASELINEASLALYAGLGSDQWSAAVHGHPTFGETLLEAVADSWGGSIHLPKKR